MIQIPENAKITDWPSSTLGHDETGMLYGIYKKNKKRSLEETINTTEEFKKEFNGNTPVNLFLTLKTQPYPTKIFDNETTAKEWLNQYL